MRSSAIAIFSGIGIGLLIGLLMGLAVSPVVGVIIGALSSSLALILGLNDKHVTEHKSLRIGAFGICCVLGTLFGIYARTHNLFAPSLQRLKSEYVALGFSEDEALSLIKYKEFGLLDDVDTESLAGKEIINLVGDSIFANRRAKREQAMKDTEEAREEEAGPAPEFAAPLVTRKHAAVLFNGKTALNDCRQYLAVLRADSKPTVVHTRLKRVKSPLWKTLYSDLLEKMPHEESMKAFLTARDGICACNEESLKAALELPHLTAAKGDDCLSKTLQNQKQQFDPKTSEWINQLIIQKLKQ